MLSLAAAAAIAACASDDPAPEQAVAEAVTLRLANRGWIRADYEANPSRYEGSLESNIPQLYPETTPAFVNIAADAAGHVWLSRWTPEDGREDARIQYDPITVDGTHVASIELPSGTRVLRAGEGEILLLERDDMDVQYVRVHDLFPARDG